MLCDAMLRTGDLLFHFALDRHVQCTVVAQSVLVRDFTLDDFQSAIRNFLINVEISSFKFVVTSLKVCDLIGKAIDCLGRE